MNIGEGPWIPDFCDVLNFLDTTSTISRLFWRMSVGLSWLFFLLLPNNLCSKH